jgi:antitoxin PrlF
MKRCNRLFHLTSQISPSNRVETNPALEEFLNFLARDIIKNPQYMQAMSADLVSHVQSLVIGVDLDLDAPLNAVEAEI